MQQLLPDEEILSAWRFVRSLDRGRVICRIEKDYLKALNANNLNGVVTFGEITDALEKYLKENQND